MTRELASPMGMNKLHGLVALALGLALATGCAHEEKSSSPSASAAAPAAQGGEMKAGAPVAAARSLVVTMDVGVTVADVDHSRTTIRAEVERAGGYIADASTSGRSTERSVRMELRIPAGNVQGVRAALGRLGEITSDVEKVQDVTEERADLEARLRNARTSEKRILEIMATKTGTIAEVIEAEKEVSRIRDSIERMEGQKRSLDGRIDLATVHLTLTGQAGPPAWQTPGKSIASAARGGVRAAAAAGVYAVMAFVAVAPVLLPIAALVLGIVLALRGRRRAALVSGRPARERMRASRARRRADDRTGARGAPPVELRLGPRLLRPSPR